MFLGFIFPNKLTDFMENKFSDELISNYRDDLDFQHVVDLVQTVKFSFNLVSILQLLLIRATTEM